MGLPGEAAVARGLPMPGLGESAQAWLTPNMAFGVAHASPRCPSPQTFASIDAPRSTEGRASAA